jgi:hypothetical protein
MSTGPVTKLYEQFEPAERLALLREAMARQDHAEANRLGQSCPRRDYTQVDAAFGDRMDHAFDTMAVVCIDLRALWAKLDILHWAIGTARLMATHHQITATFAFMDGERFAKRLPQLDFFSRERQPEEDDGLGEEDDDEEHAADEQDDEAELSAPQVLRTSSHREGELARRMMAVEDRVQGMTDTVFLALFRTAHEHAQQLANTWEAFGRFCRDRVGVTPETMLDAWGFPIAADFKGMLKRYERVKPDPAKVDEYFGLITSSWDKRFGE